MLAERMGCERTPVLFVAFCGCRHPGRSWLFSPANYTNNSREFTNHNFLSQSPICTLVFCDFGTVAAIASRGSSNPGPLCTPVNSPVCLESMHHPGSTSHPLSHFSLLVDLVVASGFDPLQVSSRGAENSPVSLHVKECCTFLSHWTSHCFVHESSWKGFQMIYDRDKGCLKIVALASQCQDLEAPSHRDWFLCVLWACT